ncbi:hypothetical protein MHBO_001704 [Bonamia ostreae]|uniref:Helicase C-terminal domain-containing protein n=1 Tax=Bonamia ostreae TaxID=126728 RepID=A0ABV2AJW8_9EUKA
MAITGGPGLAEQMKELTRRRPSFIVGTATRLWEILNSKHRVIDNEKTVCVVFDEFDQALRSLLVKKRTKIQKPSIMIAKMFASQENTQLIGCSATYDQKTVDKVAQIGFKNNNLRTFAINKDKVLPHVLHQFAVGYHLDFERRLDLFLSLYRKLTPRSVLLIVPDQNFESRKLIDRLNQQSLRTVFLNESTLSGDRKAATERFEEEEIKIAVTTEYFLRGIDLDFVSHVFAWSASDRADLATVYQHLSGRAGRPSRELPFLLSPGKCITLVDFEEIPLLEKIEKKLGFKFSRLN